MANSEVKCSIIRSCCEAPERSRGERKAVARKTREMGANSEAVKADLKSVGTLPRNDVAARSARAAATPDDHRPKTTDEEVPPKKRKTRRGKCKRRNVHPYKKSGSKNKLLKAEAPYNSNRFLIEDHGNLEEIDERLKNNDQISTSTVTRTRDSSFSIDSEGEFYSAPDDEEEFLIRDFDDQYESLQNERLQAMTKSELIQEYLLLEGKIEMLTKRLKSKTPTGSSEEAGDYQREIQRLTSENEKLKRENDLLRSKLSASCSSGSEDSETDSSDSCSSSSSSSLSRSTTPVAPDYTQTNGHSPPLQTV